MENFIKSEIIDPDDMKLEPIQNEETEIIDPNDIKSEPIQNDEQTEMIHLNVNEVKKEFNPDQNIDNEGFDPLNIKQEEIQKFNCHICNEEFDQQGLELHLFHNHNSGEGVHFMLQGLSTPKPPKAFDVHEGVKLEYGTDAISENLICTEFDSVVPNKQSLSHHKISQKKCVKYGTSGVSEDLICKECNFVAKNKQSLSKHQKVGHKVCEKCGKKFNGWSSKRDLTTHLKKCGVIHKCLYCLKQFQHKSRLKDHEKSCKRNHKCDFCDKTFKLSNELKSHIICVHHCSMRSRPK